MTCCNNRSVREYIFFGSFRISIWWLDFSSLEAAVHFDKSLPEWYLFHFRMNYRVQWPTASSCAHVQLELLQNCQSRTKKKTNNFALVNRLLDGSKWIPYSNHGQQLNELAECSNCICWTRRTHSNDSGNAQTHIDRFCQKICCILFGESENKDNNLVEFTMSRRHSFIDYCSPPVASRKIR